MAILHVNDLGAAGGEPVLCVHGITAHGMRFRRLAEEAWPERRTLAVDLRGHGFSLASGPWNVAQHVADLIDTLDAHRVDAVDVLGHSYGGVIALALLVRAPDRVRSIGLLDPAFERPAEWASQMAMATITDPGHESLEAATIARNAGLGDAIHPAVVEDVSQHLTRDDAGRYRFRFHRPAVVAGWGELCAPIPTVPVARPAMLVVADQAGLVTDAIEQRLRSELPGLAVTHLDCGHMHYWERFEDTAAAIRSFWSTR